ncbi:hypothetical protein FQN55_009491 [Onygenales sp. PD_40]|nr:hypothetical protein FQN55_009491 [Onygenales sp. PD_40]KAK2774993.1 hypothetical protein FQN53_003342 [Emmonsiellopsis sp. PD_33]KAK2779321.1 hypothetical protein FQN52_002490 [Onygenales sp. PD_12]KAK2794223.1 hypothetical protein FQN51_000924 [Onygenales sp. PD_10]
MTQLEHPTDSPGAHEDGDTLPDAPPPEINEESQETRSDAGGDIHTPSTSGGSSGNAKDVVKLEDMFDGDDDDEFPASSAAAPKIESSPEPPKPSGPAPISIDSETMYAFYLRLFPFKYLFQWLNHGVKPTPDFGNREFAFTLQNEAYLRYQSYPTAELLRKDILRLNPSRFEIGPVYSTNPRDRKALPKTSLFKPVSKELVFDIDLTDYDEIRTCCTAANICEKCWTFVTMAIKVIDAALRDDFGFEHILWVYSGRRGAHAWVCDAHARNLPDDRRRAIASYLEAIRGGSQSGKKVNLKRPLHPHLSRSLEILKPYFASTILIDQDAFGNSEQASRLLALLPDKSLTDALRKKWDSAPDRASTSKWNDIDTVAKTAKSRTQDPKSKPLDTKALLEAKQDIALEYTYPRLDAEVSKKLIHLLKSPFVVHPRTGRVCVPIDIRKVDKFDPLSVPTVDELIAEINAWDVDAATNGNGNDEDEEDTKKPLGDVGERVGSVPDSDATRGGGGKRVQDYEKTSLKPYIDYFRSFVAGLIKAERTVKRERGEEGDDGDDGSAMEF